MGDENVLKIYTDGGSRGNPGPAASAFVVYKNKKLVYKNAFFLGKKTNNYAEYYAVKSAVNWLLQNTQSFLRVEFFIDSELVVNQLNGRYKIKSKNLLPLIQCIKAAEGKMNKNISYLHILREKNTVADMLVNEKIDQNYSAVSRTSA